MTRKPPTPKPLRPEDAALWAAVTKDVAPLKGAKPVRFDAWRHLNKYAESR